MKKLFIMSIFLPLMLCARNPFCWDEKIKPIECGGVVPNLEGISTSDDGMRLAVFTLKDKQSVCEEGERVGQWKIRAIGSHSAVLQGLDGKTCTISLHLEEE